MMTTHSTSSLSASIPSIDAVLLNKIIDGCFEKALDDYRVNRFFNSNPVSEQTKPLKDFIARVLNGAKGGELTDTLDEFFAAAFARSNAKPSLVNGNDFAFLLDVVGGRDLQVITPLCPCHNFLLKLEPNDDNYDVLMEHLQATLNELSLDKPLVDQILAFAESGRESALGRQEPVD